MARLAVASAWTTLLALTVGAGCGGTESDAAGSGGSGGAATTAATTTGATSTSGSGSAGGAAPFVCDPPAEPGSIYEKTGTAYGFPETIAMCKYTGDVMLIVNTAAV